MRVPPLVCVFPGVFLSSRVTGACPVTTDLIMRVNVRTTTTTTTTNNNNNNNNNNIINTIPCDTRIFFSSRSSPYNTQSKMEGSAQNEEERGRIGMIPSRFFPECIITIDRSACGLCVFSCLPFVEKISSQIRPTDYCCATSSVMCSRYDILLSFLAFRGVGCCCCHYHTVKQLLSYVLCALRLRPLTNNLRIAVIVLSRVLNLRIMKVTRVTSTR